MDLDSSSKATNHLGLRGHVLDMKFGSQAWRDTAPCSLFSPEFDNDFTHFHDNTLRAFPKLSLPVLPSPTGFFVPRTPWILEHPSESWLWAVPKIEALAAQVRTAFALADYCTFGSPCRNVVSGWKRGQ